ncbi:MAG: hypothetical protein ABIP32_10075 [Chthoniobacterales bacterium]
MESEENAANHGKDAFLSTNIDVCTAGFVFHILSSNYGALLAV